MEKQLSRYHNDNYDNEANVAIEHLNSKERTHCKYTKWFRCISGKIILVFLIMGLFIVAQAFRLPAKWQKKWPHGYNTTSNLDITKATKGLQSLWNHDTPFFSLAPAPGISIAVSKDPDSNIQLYDLDSSGVLRIRRRSNSNDQTNTKWTSPQIIPTDPKPKQSSPLAAIAFQFRAGVTVSYKDPLSALIQDRRNILKKQKRKRPYLLLVVQELRVYYLDTSNRIVEFGTSFSSSSDLSWSRTEHFSTGSTGGLAAVWLGSEGIRLYFVDKDDSVGQLVWYANSWRSPTSLKLPALAGSPVAAQSSYFGGDFYGIFLHYVNRDKELTEGQYIPQVDPDNFRPGE